MTTNVDAQDACRIFGDIPYARTTARTLKLDLRIPCNQRLPPLVLYIPMGGMRSCAKENAPWWLTESGFAMASIECRVSSEAIAPAAVYDVKAAVRWLRVHAAEYGYRPDAIGAWGQSAGGLLAALIGTSGEVAALEGDGPYAGVSSRVQAVCDQCGAPHDFAYFAQPEVKKKYEGVTENLRLYLGGLVEDRMELARLVSPRTYVSGTCPPMLLMHGDADHVVPLEDTIAFADALQAAGGDVTLRILPGAGHCLEEKLIRRDVESFFARILRPARGDL